MRRATTGTPRSSRGASRATCIATATPSASGRARQLADALTRRGRAHRRPRRDAGLERLPAHGAVLRGRRHGRRDPHDQSAAAPRADRLDRQPRRRHAPGLRPHLPADRRGDRRTLPEREELDRDGRRRPPAVLGEGREPGQLRAPAGDAARTTTAGRRSTNAARSAFATRRAPPAIRRARLYTHRSTVLHAYGAALPDAMGASARDCILPVVPMFHVNAWGLPYSCPLVGAKIVFPGPQLDGKSLFELFEAEGVTYSAGVPTVWLGLLQHVTAEQAPGSAPCKRTVIGGSACPPAMIRTFKRPVRGRGDPRLGHDRDVAAGHAEQAAEQAPEACRESAPAEDPREAGARDLRRRHEDRRRRRHANCPGTARPSATCWCAVPGSSASTSAARAATR